LRLSYAGRDRAGKGLVDFVPGIDVRQGVLFQAFSVKKGV